VEAGGSNPFANHSSTCRDGERHPGRPDGGALRGASSERGPRSVRRTSRESSRGERRADDSGCPKVAEEGNVVARAPQSSRTRRRHERSSHALGRRVLRSVLRPVRVDPHYTRWRQKRPRGGAFVSASRLGKPTQVGGTSTGVGRMGAARLAACHRSRKRESVARREKEGGRGLRPCEDQEPRLGCSHVVFQLQKSVGDGWPRISSANALQKERSGSSERGPSPE
jgi:hypothetical protein